MILNLISNNFLLHPKLRLKLKLDYIVLMISNDDFL